MVIPPSASMAQARQHQQGGRVPRWILVPLTLVTLGVMLFCVFSVLPGALSGPHGEAPARSTPTTGPVTKISPTVVLSPTLTPSAWLTPHLAVTSQPSLSPTPSPQPTVLPTPSPGSVSPVFECVIRQGGTAFLARFGYVNVTPSVVTIPVGSENALSPASVNGSQPTAFSPGTQSDALQVGISKGQIAWSLDGSTATATFHGPHC